MSILIKDMEMPASCSRCGMLEGDYMDGLCHAASRWLDDDEYWTWYVYPEGDIDDSKPCNCPLIPVPPHGRLIDADVLEKQAQKRLLVCHKNDNQFQMPYEVMRAISLAPTIIEADTVEGENNG